MSKFILVQSKRNNRDATPVLLAVSAIDAALPVFRDGDLQGVGSRLHVRENITPSGKEKYDAV